MAKIPYDQIFFFEADSMWFDPINKGDTCWVNFDVYEWCVDEEIDWQGYNTESMVDSADPHYCAIGFYKQEDAVQCKLLFGEMIVK